MPPTPQDPEDLSDEDAAWLAGQGTRRVLADGEMLIRAGETPDAAFVVLEGALLASDGRPGGRPPRRLGPGRVAGGEPLADGGPSMCTVRAQGGATVLVLPHRALRERMDADPSFARRVRAAASPAGGSGGPPSSAGTDPEPNPRVSELIERMLRRDFT